MRRPDATVSPSGLSPEAERELAALDAALAGDSVAPDLAELGELARILREDRPEPGADFAERLDERAAAGFARDGAARSGRRAPAWSLRRPQLLGAAAAGLLVLVVGVALSVNPPGGDDEFETFSLPVARPSPAPPSAATDDAGPSGGGARPDAQALRAATGKAVTPAGLRPLSRSLSAAPPTPRARKVERSASLTLAAPADDVDDVADGIVRVTDDVGGFVQSSQVGSTDGGEGGAHFRLRVPSRRLQDALASLSDLAHVRSRSEDSQDVTPAFVSVNARLSEDRAERRGLLRQLARATTPNQTASIRARLRLVSMRIAQAEARLRGLRRRTDFSTVAVAVEATRGSADEGGTWTPGDALHDALRVLTVAAGVALVTLALALPLGLLALAAWLTGRAARRRRRERALEPA